MKTENQSEEMNLNENQLVNAEGLLKALFPEDCRPTVRWVREQQKRKAIPFCRIGRLIFFDVGAVRESIARRQTTPPVDSAQ